jgi:ABC-type multidrug transport system ATPase subunit
VFLVGPVKYTSLRPVCAHKHTVHKSTRPLYSYCTLPSIQITMSNNREEAKSLTSAAAPAADDTMNFQANNACKMRWTNIIKTVELKENQGGLIKSTIGEAKGASTPEIAGSDDSIAPVVPGTTHKIILNQISGQAKPGEILALMGPSGSGKTSLLDVLSSRSAYQDGTITLNDSVITNRPGKVKALKRKTAYIKQQDIFFEHLTVKDQLTYTAFLRLGDEYTKVEKHQEVSKVINLLRLNKCQDTPIRLVSGGERKRVNIGTELLTNPSIIMLDEPTSGLDSTSAVALIELLVSLAHDHGKTVITSIHQPSSAVFHKFDNVLFLADGCVVYYGSPSYSLDYCKNLGMTCPDGYNAADHWMDLLVEDSAIEDDAIETDSNESNPLIGKDSNAHSNFPIKLGTMVDSNKGNGPAIMDGSANKEEPNALRPSLRSSMVGRMSIKNVILKMSNISTVNKPMHLLDDTKRKRDEYLSKKTSKAILINNWNVDAFAEEMEEGRNCNGSLSSSVHSKDGADDDLEQTGPKFNTTWGTQFYVLLHRSLKNSRSSILTKINITKSVALGTLTGMLWFQIKNTEATVPDKGSFLFFSMTYWIFDGIFTAVFTFPIERTIIFKERASGSYHLSAYFLSKTLSEMPTRLVLPTMFWTIAYWMSNVNPSFSVFLGTLGCLLLAVLAGESYGLLCGALVMDFEKAMTIMVVVSLTAMAAGGYYIKNIPTFIGWIKYISPFKPGYEAAQTLVFDRSVPCDGSSVLAEYCVDGAKTVSSDNILKFLASEGSIGFNIGILVALMIVPRYLAFLALKNKRGAERS